MRWIAMLVVSVGCAEGFEGGEGGEGGGGGGTSTGGGGGGGSCSTGRHSNAEEGPLMKPGGDCIGCHSGGEGTDFTVAGTVMNDYADELGCEGIEGVTVSITDADGAVHELVSNAVGNFYTTARIPGPYTVELSYMGDTRPMGSGQSDGDCVSCHTSNGAGGAPGRILAP